MKYTELLEKLQNENKEHIILVKNGIFFVAIGKDAIALNELLGLQLTCMREGLCKVRISNQKFGKIHIKIKRYKKIICNIYI